MTGTRATTGGSVLGKRLRGYLAAFGIGVLALAGVPAAGFGQAGDYQNLEPGKRADLDEKASVNFVFVGYDQGDVSAGRFRSTLPDQYKPIVRSRYFYNKSVKKSLLGLNYTYDYNVRFADGAYERRFFSYLSNAAKPAPLTDFQKLYNGKPRKFCKPPNGEPKPCQKQGVRDIKKNYRISALSVEEWLAANPPAGVDTERNTVFFINWWGNGEKPRKGFKHHVYTKTNEPEPDTDFNFGRDDSRKLIAWGGTPADDEESGLGSTRRVWFHDLSAGPDSFTDNWNVDDPDLTGDGKEDYRLPPVWEYYAKDGYHPASRLTGDLARVARYVAIDLFFTSSPLYPPQYTPRLLPNKINLDVNTVEGIPGKNYSRRYQTPSLMLDEIRELHHLPYSIDQQDVAYEGRAKRCYLLWLANVPCYPKEVFAYPGTANLFLYGADNLGRLLDDERTAREYEAVLLNWAVEDGPRGLTSPPLLGYADDNYRNGTQSFVFSFISPDIAQNYGLTTTEIHEYGHHLNLSHPFDGFDYENKTQFGWDGKYYFTGVGNEVNSIMSYVDLNWDFSQFDRDNTDRFQAAAYINNANALARKIQNDPDADQAADELAAADVAYGEAKTALARHDYAGTFGKAREAYEHALQGARDAGVPVKPSNNGRTASKKAEISSVLPGRYIDRPRPAEREQPMRRQDAADIEVHKAQHFSPLAHRLRR
jgi:hypothetical protein